MMYVPQLIIELFHECSTIAWYEFQKIPYLGLEFRQN